MTYREADYRARAEQLEAELDRSQAEVRDLRRTRHSRLLVFTSRIRWWHVAVILAIAGGFWLASLPPRPTHKHVLAGDGQPALETQCDVKHDCVVEAANECGASNLFEQLDFRDKVWFETVCITTIAGKVPITTCSPERRYAAWLTYRCRVKP